MYNDIIDSSCNQRRLYNSYETNYRTREKTYIFGWSCTVIYQVKHEQYLKHYCMEKHTILLVRKCLDGKVCSKFNECFEFNHHNKSSRNNVLLNVPRVKLEMANAGFFFMGAKYLIPRNVSRSVINAVVFKPR